MGEKPENIPLYCSYNFIFFWQPKSIFITSISIEGILQTIRNYASESCGKARTEF